MLTAVAQGVTAHRLFAEIASRDVPRGVAEAEWDHRLAMSLGEDMGMRPLVAHCHFGLGKLYRRLGKQQEVREQLATAETMYRDMGMELWPEQATASPAD